MDSRATFPERGIPFSFADLCLCFDERALRMDGWLDGCTMRLYCESEVNNEILLSLRACKRMCCRCRGRGNGIGFSIDSSLRVVKGFFLVISSTVSFLFSQFFRLEHGFVCENPISHITPIPLHHLRIFSSTKLST